MVYLKRATKSDMHAINALLEQYGLVETMPEIFNHRDIAIQARTNDGKLVGFIWGGLTAKNSLLYIDYFVVDPDLAKHQVGLLLAKELLKESKKLGVKQWLASTRRNEFHHAVCFNAAKLGMFADTVPHTFLAGDVTKMCQRAGI